MIHTKAAILTLSFLATSALHAQEPLVVGDPSEVEKHGWNDVDTSMDLEEYRAAYRYNQRQIADFIGDYSESTLMALGIPRKGVHMMGAVAGAAVGQEATLYLNDSKTFAIDIKDAAEDDRAVYIGVKLDW